MEFGEKLQELRKCRGLTQEELAEALYVSRTAISKWESGRGYPNIESLKDISKFFSVSIDELLSGEKLLSIAETENKSNLRNMCGRLFGVTDLLAFMLIVLPLYPKTVGDYVYSVNLISYTEVTHLNRVMYWTLFLGLIFIGSLKIFMIQSKPVMILSIIFGVAAVLVLSLAGESYAVTMAFLLLLIKGFVLFKYIKLV